MPADKRTKTLLNEAIRAYRTGPRQNEGLSESARSAVLGEAMQDELGMRPLAPLFVPVRRMVLAGATPLVLLGAFLVGVALLQNPSLAPEAAAIEAAKVGDRVVFSISNGGREHVVVRSTRPDRFETNAGVTVKDGSFEDRLASAPNLVYYRID